MNYMFNLRGLSSTRRSVACETAGSNIVLGPRSVFHLSVLRITTTILCSTSCANAALPELQKVEPSHSRP